MNAAHIDSESAAAGEVLTSDGSRGATWEASAAGGGGALTQATEATLGGVRGATALQAIAANGTAILAWTNNRLRQLLAVALPTMVQSDIDDSTTGRKAVTGELIAANAGGGGTTTELTQAMVEDDTDTTFGTVSGERLAQAVAEHETGGTADTDRVILADATAIDNTAGPHEITLDAVLTARNLLTFHVVTSAAASPDALGYILSDDLLARTAEATAPSDVENALPFTTTNIAQLTQTSQGGNYLVWFKDDTTLWIQSTRLAAHSLTITATPLGGGAGTSEQQSGSGVLTRVNIHEPPSDPFELTTTGTGSALSVGNENQIFFTAVEKARVERCVIILRIDDTFNIKADISKEEMDRLPDITELRPDPIVGTDESGVIYLSGRTQISADSREPQLPNPTWAYIDFRRLANRYGICIGFTDDSTGLRWRSLRTYCNSDIVCLKGVKIAIVSAGMYHVLQVVRG